MGLFSFVKNAGAEYLWIGKTVAQEEVESRAKLEMKNVEACNKLKGAVSSMGLNVTDFGVAITGDTAYAFGEASDQETREKAVLVVGNTEGIASVDDRMHLTAQAVPAPEASFHTVQSGDSLSKISKEVYGDAMKYNIIFEANKPMLSHPDKIYPGQVLRCPS